MAWIEAWKSTAGYFTDVFFNTAIGNTNDIQWVNAPDPTGVRRLASYDGTSSSGLQTGEEIGLLYLKNFQKDVEFTLATFPIQGASENAEMRIKYKSTADPGLDQRMVSFGLFRRVIAADQTYVDTQYTPWIDILIDYTGSQTLYITEKISFDIGFLQYHNLSYFVFGLHRTETFIRTGTLRYSDTYFCIPYTSWLTWAGGDIPPELIDPDLGPASEPGGYGPGSGGGTGGSGGPAPTFDGTSDPWIDTPTKPGIAALGLVNLYKCDANSLVNLGAELFPDIHWPTSLSDVGEVLAAVSDSIWNSKLIDYIVSAHIVPVNVTAGALTDIKVGTRTLTGILARPISDDIIEFNCGTLHIDEYYTNFVDYMTRCRVYIPFHGMVEIKPEYWQSADLTLKYLFNVIDGSFVAKLYSTISRHQKTFTALIGQYTGCACVHVPMTGQSYASMFGGMIANAGGMAAGFASGNVGQAATSALNSVALAGGGPGMDMSNPYNASAGFYGHARPYVIIERPISHFPTHYAQEKGFPLLVSKTIGSCHGLTICSSPVINFACTDEEAQEIRAALQEGVIV